MTTFETPRIICAPTGEGFIVHDQWAAKVIQAILSKVAGGSHDRRGSAGMITHEALGDVVLGLYGVGVVAPDPARRRFGELYEELTAAVGDEERPDWPMWPWSEESPAD